MSGSRQPGERLRVVFMGSPDFAVPSLRALAAEHEVLAVVTQPDRPRGRGRVLAAPAVKQVAEALGFPVLQPRRVRAPESVAALAALQADLFVVAAFGQILSAELLALPRLGCVNVHASLLPRYRGAAPINWAVLRGEAQSGVTIMLMDQGIDTGAVLAREPIALRADETAGSLHDRLAPLGAELLRRTLEPWARGALSAQPQDAALATAAPMLRKEDGCVDWRREAESVDCWVRGMDPWPAAHSTLAGQPLKLYRSQVAVAPLKATAPGQVLAVDPRGLLVACGAGAIWIRELQAAGGRRMAPTAYAAGHPLPVGAVLGLGG
ncbi:MAG: methionyl-tRNA formyltransferase [Proteobacteria bacterium]|nr:methionyl-tRNA formyltransferase [Pseudomonadota bacterium]